MREVALFEGTAQRLRAARPRRRNSHVPVRQAEHFFGTMSQASADALAAELQARGHAIARVRDDVVKSVSGRGEVDQLEELDALAARHGADYDGYGTYVGPDREPEVMHHPRLGTGPDPPRAAGRRCDRAVRQLQPAGIVARSMISAHLPTTRRELYDRTIFGRRVAACGRTRRARSRRRLHLPRR